MQEVNYRNKISTSRGKYLQLNQSMGKIYPKFLRINVGGVLVPIKKYNYHLPNPEIIKQYEIMKDEFVNKQTKELREHLDEVKEGKKKPPITARMKHINYCFHVLRIGNQRLIAEKVSEIEGLSITHQQISIDMKKMSRFYPLWLENPKELGFSTLSNEITAPST
jgi:hypothetical protein